MNYLQTVENIQILRSELPGSARYAPFLSLQVKCINNPGYIRSASQHKMCIKKRKVGLYFFFNRLLSLFPVIILKCFSYICLCGVFFFNLSYIERLEQKYFAQHTGCFSEHDSNMPFLLNKDLGFPQKQIVIENFSGSFLSLLGKQARC